MSSELSRHYRQSGWEVALATNLAEARELLLNKKIEPLLILFDMNLPDGNALDFMEGFNFRSLIASGLADYNLDSVTITLVA